MISPTKYDLIFWDFDGVIKESVSVKTDAYEELFKSYGSDVCKQVKNHHLANGGMSRFNKIPLYLKWVGLEQNDLEVQNYCDKFGRIVKDKVITSAWVPGVQDFLHSNKEKYIFIIVSATPQDEIEEICKALNFDCVFLKIYGSPASKAESIKISMLHFGVDASSCVMIGDAQADIDAAQDNNIDFIFRRHQDNLQLNIDTNIQTIENFNEL